MPTLYVVCVELRMDQEDDGYEDDEVDEVGERGLDKLDPDGGDGAKPKLAALV